MTVNVTATDSLPGYPSSPSGLTCESVSESPEDFSTFQTYLSNPFLPPCSEFGPLLTASLYSLPSSANLPPAIRLA